MKELKIFQESKIICRKSKTVEWIHKYMKGSKYVCKKRNIYEGKQKYVKANENIWKKRKIFRRKAKAKNIIRQTKNSWQNITLQDHRNLRLVSNSSKYLFRKRINKL